MQSRMAGLQVPRRSGGKAVEEDEVVRRDEVKWKVETQRNTKEVRFAVERRMKRNGSDGESRDEG